MFLQNLIWFLQPKSNAFSSLVLQKGRDGNLERSQSILQKYIQSSGAMQEKSYVKDMLQLMRLPMQFRWHFV